jgi:hypothetical protein
LKPATRIRPEPSLAQSSSRWLELHRAWQERPSFAPGPRAQEDLPLVSVCIAPTEHEHSVLSVIESIDHGLYENVEVLAAEGEADLGSTSVSVRLIPAKPRKPWMRAYARAARGKYLLFVDQAAAVQPHAIRIFLALAEKGSIERLCSGFVRLSPDHRSQSVFPAPEQAICSFLRPDPRVPLLFQSRARFLADAKAFGKPGQDCSFEPALWMLESALRGKPFVCVPKALARAARWVPNLEELDRQSVAACATLTAQLAPGIAALAPTLVRSMSDISDAYRQLRAKEKAIDVIRRTFGSPGPNA